MKAFWAVATPSLKILSSLTPTLWVTLSKSLVPMWVQTVAHINRFRHYFDHFFIEQNDILCDHVSIVTSVSSASLFRGSVVPRKPFTLDNPSNFTLVAKVLTDSQVLNLFSIWFNNFWCFRLAFTLHVLKFELELLRRIVSAVVLIRDQFIRGHSLQWLQKET